MFANRWKSFDEVLYIRLDLLNHLADCFVWELVEARSVAGGAFGHFEFGEIGADTIVGG